MDDEVARAVGRALEELAAEAPGPVAVACSGGPDSTALAHAVASARTRGVELVHVDHQLRPDSASDGARVRALGERLGVSVVVVAVDVDRGTGSLEGAARDARYAALDRLADERGWAAVLLGHTASDQAETVFMRVVRGTGVAGLAGIPTRRGRYARPLLTVWRTDVEDYLDACGLAAVDDPMNRDEAVARARARHRWLPALRRENPRVDEALVRLAASAREQRAVLESAVDLAVDACRIEGSAAPVAVSASRLSGLAPAIAKGVLQRLAVRAGLEPLDAVHQERALEIAMRPVQGTVTADLPGGALRREYDRLTFEAADGRPPRATPTARVAGPDGPYEVRSWQAGDRMRPRRLNGKSRKLSDLFADARVPRRDRVGALVVVRASDGTIVWAQYIGNAYGSAVEVTLTHP